MFERSVSKRAVNSDFAPLIGALLGTIIPGDCFAGLLTRL